MRSFEAVKLVFGNKFEKKLLRNYKKVPQVYSKINLKEIHKKIENLLKVGKVMTLNSENMFGANSEVSLFM